MLNELNSLQSSDESLWGEPKFSFEFETRLEDGDDLIQRSYTFSYAKEWDKWVFHEFEEYVDDSDNLAQRNWRRTRHVYWDNHESRDIDVPPEVTRRLEEIMNLDQVILQEP